VVQLALTSNFTAYIQGIETKKTKTSPTLSV